MVKSHRITSDTTLIERTAEVNTARDAVLGVQPETRSTTQAALCDTYDEAQEKRFHNIPGGFDKRELHTAWKPSETSFWKEI